MNRPGLPLHVGIDATSWNNDRGFGRFTREIVTALSRRDTGFRYTLLFDQPPHEPVPAAVSVLNAATRRNLRESHVGTSSRSLAYLWRMGRLVRGAAFDLFFFPGVYSYFPLLARVPCVVCFHDATAERFPRLIFPTRRNHRLWQVKTALARRQATRAMTVSEMSALDLERLHGIPRDRIDLVTEAANPVFRVVTDRRAIAGARARSGIPEDADLLVYVGGMNRHKNVMMLLEAMTRIVGERPCVHLALVGDTSGRGFDGNAPELQRFASHDPVLARHVHFTGHLADADLAPLLNGAVALVLPSLWEGFGLPAVEAMACGVPVLASRRGSLPEVVGDAGVFFEPDSPVAIADCIIGFLVRHELHGALRDAALKRAAMFTWERSAALAEISFRRCHEERQR